jgi:hypothetical protein
MTRTAVTTKELTGLLGDVDGAVCAQILDTGASFEEVAEAVSAIEDEDRFGELRHLPSTSRVAEVRAILEAALDEGDDDQVLPTSDLSA